MLLHTILMVAYNLEHLTEDASQEVMGPIQDDEALFLYAVVRGMRLRSALEIGGLGGYSAVNFCAAVGPSGIVYSVDVNSVPVVAPNHRVVVKNAAHLSRAALPDLPVDGIDLVFFDCHDYDAEMSMFERLRADGVVRDDTVLALHDTNEHPYQTGPWVYKNPGGPGWVHAQAERRMVNDLRARGYEAFQLHTRLDRHSPDLPYRHGVTLLSKPRELPV